MTMPYDIIAKINNHKKLETDSVHWIWPYFKMHQQFFGMNVTYPLLRRHAFKPNPSETIS